MSAERGAEVTVATAWEKRADVTSAAREDTSREIAPAAPIPVALPGPGQDQVLIRVGVHPEEGAEAADITEEATTEETEVVAIVETDTAEAEAEAEATAIQEAEAQVMWEEAETETRVETGTGIEKLAEEAEAEEATVRKARADLLPPPDTGRGPVEVQLHKTEEILHLELVGAP